MQWKTPIMFSVIVLVSVTTISTIVFSIWKPQFVTKTVQRQKINWGKLISMSLVLGIVAGILSYLSTMKNTSHDVINEPVNMVLSDSY